MFTCPTRCCPVERILWNKHTASSSKTPFAQPNHQYGSNKLTGLVSEQGHITPCQEPLVVYRFGKWILNSRVVQTHNPLLKNLPSLTLQINFRYQYEFVQPFLPLQIKNRIHLIKGYPALHPSWVSRNFQLNIYRHLSTNTPQTSS